MIPPRCQAPNIAKLQREFANEVPPCLLRMAFNWTAAGSG